MIITPLNFYKMPKDSVVPKVTKEKYSANMPDEQRRLIPKEDTKIMYDKDDNVLFGSRYVKGKVEYHYIPAELMDTGRPFIIYTAIAYDGKGNSNLPEGAEFTTFDELPKIFTDNKFK